MRKRTWKLLLLGGMACLALLAGCAKEQPGAEPPASSAPPPAPPDPVVSSEAPASSAVAPPPSSEIPPPPSLPADPSQPSESGGVGQVVPVETEDEDFDAYFAKNPIDKAYIDENNSAISTLDMLQVSEKYAAVWRRECVYIGTSLQKMGSEEQRAAVKKAEEEWLAGEDAAIQKINDNAQARGGSMAKVDAASERMEFYRSHAIELYKQFYQYDKNFSYYYPNGTD